MFQYFDRKDLDFDNMNCIWGYTSSSKLNMEKILGNEIKEAKQIFSALLFKAGISGVCVVFTKITRNPLVVLELIIDDNLISSFDFSPTREGEYSFELVEQVIPQSKIEVKIKVLEGQVNLPLSAIGNGMGYQLVDREFVPTNHLGLGLIIP